MWSFETAGMDDSFVLKVLHIQHEFDHELFEMVRTDALVMERLSSSPRIVDIYGHCGTSVATEGTLLHVFVHLFSGHFCRVQNFFVFVRHFFFSFPTSIPHISHPIQ